MAKYGDYDPVVKLYGDELWIVVQQPRNAQGVATGDPVSLYVTAAQMAAFAGKPVKIPVSITPGTLTALGPKTLTGIAAVGVKAGDVVQFIPSVPLPGGLLTGQAIATADDTVSITVNALLALTLGSTAIAGNIVVFK